MGRKNRITEEQILGFLKEIETGLPVKELCDKYGFSDTSLFTWLAKFCGLDMSLARRLIELEAENVRLKQLLALATRDLDAVTVIDARTKH
ncbi:transposase [Pandoraea iniqua]|uniref:Transposase n=1 Tax=Pandoraea iniqua TaxID=2508288 RepID=A0A5E4YCM7_9BURK|nr:transposase [Pandoraea iniqua]